MPRSLPSSASLPWVVSGAVSPNLFIVDSTFHMAVATSQAKLLAHTVTPPDLYIGRSSFTVIYKGDLVHKTRVSPSLSLPFFCRAPKATNIRVLRVQVTNVTKTCLSSPSSSLFALRSSTNALTPPAVREKEQACAKGFVYFPQYGGASEFLVTGTLGFLFSLI